MKGTLSSCVGFKELLKKADVDGNGEMDFPEFLQLVDNLANIKSINDMGVQEVS